MSFQEKLPKIYKLHGNEVARKNYCNVMLNVNKTNDGEKLTSENDGATSSSACVEAAAMVIKNMFLYEAITFFFKLEDCRL